MKKNLFIINKELVTSVSKIKTKKRNSTILPVFVGKIIQVHNGKRFKKVTVLKEMVGHKLGEFVLTRQPFTYKKQKKNKK